MSSAPRTRSTRGWRAGSLELSCPDREAKSGIGRAMLRNIFRVGALLSAFAATSASAQDFKVTLLGTGSPFPDPNRFSAATLVEAGQEKLLFDVGRGATIRLNQIGVPMGAINAVFITHFHSDHTSGLPDLWLTGWIGRYYGNRKSPFRIIGPKGTTSLMRNLEQAYSEDVRIRYLDE